jgi:hypothetical protein
MSRIRLTALAVSAAVTSFAPATAQADARAGLRVTTVSRQLLQVDAIGASRSWRDTNGLTYALPKDRALGQLVTGTALFGRHLGVASTPLGPFVQNIAGVAAPEKGFWALFVNNTFATVGARDIELNRGDEVVWLLDPDYTRPGPNFLDLDLVSRRGGTATFRVTRVAATGDGYAARPARGAAVTVGGHDHSVGRTGLVRVPVRRGLPFAARATERGTVPSELVFGVG